MSIFSNLYGILQMSVRAAGLHGGRAYPSSSRAMEILIPLGVWAVYKVIFGRAMVDDAGLRCLASCEILLIEQF